MTNLITKCNEVTVPLEQLCSGQKSSRLPVARTNQRRGFWSWAGPWWQNGVRTMRDGDRGEKRLWWQSEQISLCQRGAGSSAHRHHAGETGSRGAPKHLSGHHHPQVWGTKWVTCCFRRFHPRKVTEMRVNGSRDVIGYTYRLSVTRGPLGCYLFVMCLVLITSCTAVAVPQFAWFSSRAEQPVEVSLSKTHNSSCSLYGELVSQFEDFSVGPSEWEKLA